MPVESVSADWVYRPTCADAAPFAPGAWPPAPASAEPRKNVSAIVVSADDPDAIAPALKQAMQNLARERREQLDALPDDVGRAIRGLKDYEFVEPKAAEK